VPTSVETYSKKSKRSQYRRHTSRCFAAVAGYRLQAERAGSWRRGLCRSVLLDPAAVISERTTRGHGRSPLGGRRGRTSTRAVRRTLRLNRDERTGTRGTTRRRRRSRCGVVWTTRQEGDEGRPAPRADDPDTSRAMSNRRRRNCHTSSLTSWTTSRSPPSCSSPSPLWTTSQAFLHEHGTGDEVAKPWW